MHHLLSHPRQRVYILLTAPQRLVFAPCKGRQSRFQSYREQFTYEIQTGFQHVDLFVQFPGVIGLLYFCEDLFLVYNLFFHLSNLKGGGGEREREPSCVNICTGTNSIVHQLKGTKTKLQYFIFFYKLNFYFSLGCMLNSIGS